MNTRQIKGSFGGITSGIVSAMGRTNLGIEDYPE
jgi:hypothetical protein